MNLIPREEDMISIWKNYCLLSFNISKILKCRDQQVTEILGGMKTFARKLALPDYSLLSLHKEVIEEEIITEILGTSYAFKLGVTEYFEVMRSLQKPKKIWYICSNGCKKPYLCKINDEIRKDNRVIGLLEQYNVTNSRDIEYFGSNIPSSFIY